MIPLDQLEAGATYRGRSGPERTIVSIIPDGRGRWLVLYRITLKHGRTPDRICLAPTFADWARGRVGESPGRAALGGDDA